MFALNLMVLWVETERLHLLCFVRWGYREARQLGHEKQFVTLPSLYLCIREKLKFHVLDSGRMDTDNIKGLVPRGLARHWTQSQVCTSCPPLLMLFMARMGLES